MGSIIVHRIDYREGGRVGVLRGGTRVGNKKSQKGKILSFTMLLKGVNKNIIVTFITALHNQ